MSNVPQIVWYDLDWEDPPTGSFLMWFPNESEERQRQGKVVHVRRSMNESILWTSGPCFHFDFKRDDWPTHYALITPPNKPI